VEAWSTLLALIVLVADIVAIVQIWRSRIEVGRKTIWSLVVVLLPVVGLIMWLVAAGHFAKVRL
jgi:hypothetical protein